MSTRLLYIPSVFGEFPKIGRIVGCCCFRLDPGNLFVYIAFRSFNVSRQTTLSVTDGGTRWLISGSPWFLG